MSSTANPPVFHTALRRLVEVGADDRPAVLATGLSHLDALLPGGGVPLGALTELLEGDAPAGPPVSSGQGPPEGSSGLTFAAHLACQALSQAVERPSPRPGSGFVVWIDSAGDLHPPALFTLGLPPSRFLLVRPAKPVDALWAFDQAIRCRQVAAAIVSLTRLEMAHLRRLQLAAREGGGLAILLRPGIEARQPSAAAARLRVRAIPAERPARKELDGIVKIELDAESRGVSVQLFSFAVELLRVRGGWGEGGVRVDVRWNAEDPHGTAQNPLHCVSAPLE